MIKFIVIGFLLLISDCSLAEKNDANYSSENNSFIGLDICNLDGEVTNRLGVYLDLKYLYSVEYRERSGVEQIFLVKHEKSNNSCGVIEGVLDVTNIKRVDEAVELICYTGSEGGTTWGKWGHVIGLVKNENELKKNALARLSWRVNVDKKRFEKMDVMTRCDRTGYADEGE